MVQQDTLDRVFACLADPVRRGVLIRLGDGPASVGELTEPTGMTLTGMTKHLRVLEEAGLIVTEKVGRARLCRLATAPLDEAMAWIAFYQRLWARRLDGLDVYFTLRSGTRQHETPPYGTPPSDTRQLGTPPRRTRHTNLGNAQRNPSDDGKGPGE